MSFLAMISWFFLVVIGGVHSVTNDHLMVAIIMRHGNHTTQLVCANPARSINTKQNKTTTRLLLTNLAGLNTQAPNSSVDLSMAVTIHQREIFDLKSISRNVTWVLLNEDEFQRSMEVLVPSKMDVALLSETDFAKLEIIAAERQAQIDVILDTPQESSLSSPLVLISIMGLIALITLLLACWITYLNRNQLLLELQTRSSILQRSKFAIYLMVGGTVVVVSILLLLYYFFYDVMVYLAIAVFFICCTLSISYCLAIFLKVLFVPIEKSIPLNFQLCKRNVSWRLPLLRLVMLPFGIIFMSIWVVYRNDPSIGWPMQCVAGIFLITYLLSVSIPLPSVKTITILFSAFVFYDIFFVFITRLFVTSPAPPNPPTNTTLMRESTVVRNARSATGHSFMEAVALGTAGNSGELIPAAYRLNIRYTVGSMGCTYRDLSMLLGFGDVFIPGLLCAFLVFYDALWKVPCYRHFSSSILGYFLGLVIAFGISMLSSQGQPALIYLCPCTLGMTVIIALAFGGKEELTKLWYGHLPIDPNPVDDSACGNHANDNKNSSTSYPYEDQGNPEFTSNPSVNSVDPFIHSDSNKVPLV